MSKWKYFKQTEGGYTNYSERPNEVTRTARNTEQCVERKQIHIMFIQEHIPPLTLIVHGLLISI